MVNNEKKIRNNKDRIRVKCDIKLECNWEMMASRQVGSIMFMVRYYHKE